MKETTPREKVLKNIRNALMHKNENPFLDAQIYSEMYAPVDSVTDVAFAQSFTAAGGVFFYCEDEKSMVMQLAALARERDWRAVYTFIPELVDILNLIKLNPVSDSDLPDDLKAGITFCESLIARTGTILVSSFASSGRRMVIHPEIHIVIGYASQVVQDIHHALDELKNRYGDTIPSFVSLITGPSRTADIEKTLVMGAHGPRELMLFFIDDRPDPEQEPAQT